MPSDNKYSPDYLPPGYDPEQDGIELLSHDPSWLNMAKNEIEKLRAALNSISVLDIQHVGSTAIPNIAAKPILDIQITVDSIPPIKTTAITAIEALNYHYWYGNPDPTRMLFIKGMPPFGKRRTHHVHIFEKNSPHWRNRLLFRDHLLANPKTAKAYETLKIALAKQYAFDREGYTKAKTDFVEEILRNADS